MYFIGRRKVEELLERKRAQREKHQLDEEPLELEKGDMFAIMVAAFRVFFPMILVFVGVISLITWLFTSL